ncbi:MAG: hypothetical protein ACREQ9_10585, partial [Candidatus Binatia bacterium]
CYLGPEANRIPRAPLPEVKRQLDRIREWLGAGGNVQLTDGEVTLMPEPDLVELIRYARTIGLVPMVMTHGDSFRRRRGLLERLMVAGGLSEVSLHVDTTQRGRLGGLYRCARREEELDSLRDELADLVRRARRDTGRTLDVASTVTVTCESLEGVPGIVRWMCRNADAFKMVSFQPIAPVGRTEEGLGGGVGVEELWANIAEGAWGDAGRAPELLRHRGLFGHPACSRFVQGAVVSRAGEEPVFRPLFHPDDPRDAALAREWYERFGGITTRLDIKARALARIAGVVRSEPRLVFAKVLPFLARSLVRLDSERPLRFAADWLRGRARIDYLNIVSHHFMSAADLATPLGRERLGLCVFKVPIGERLVSMCEVNALGVREDFYAAVRSGHAVRSFAALPDPPAAGSGGGR